MAMSPTGGGRGPLAEINVTPLVDVMLVLLIIFMVAAPNLTTGVAIDLPQTKAEALPEEEEKLLLTIDKQQKVFLGETEIPRENLAGALKTNARLQADKEVYVRADTDVPYGVAVHVFNLLRQAGVETLGLVTDPSAPTPPGFPPAETE